MDAINIILGATGQVGSHILKQLMKAGVKSRAVVRDSKSTPCK